MANKTVKETADLKPIGTVNDTNYDLYIKKTGCTLTLEVHKNKNKTQMATVYDHQLNDINYNKDQGADRYPGSTNNYADWPSSNRPYAPPYDYADYESPPNYNNRRPDYGFMYAPNFYGPPIKVQSSLISVSPSAGDNNNLNYENDGNIYDRRKNYVSYQYARPTINEEDRTNSLDPAGDRRPSIDRLPPLYSSNYNKPQSFYAEESNYEQHRDHFSSSIYEYPAPFPENLNRYPLEANDHLQVYNYGSRPEFGRPPIDIDAYPTRPIKGSGDLHFNYGVHGHGVFTNHHEDESKPSYRPEIPNDRYYDYWPSYSLEPSYSEFTYGNRYPYYKQSEDNPYYIQSSTGKGDTTKPSTPANKTDNLEQSHSEKNTTVLELPLKNPNESSALPSFGNGSIVSQTKGPHGETITSIITEMESGELVHSAK